MTVSIDSAALDERLRKVHAGRSDRRIFVGIATPETRQYAFAGEPIEGHAADHWLPIGCCSKLLVAALIARAVSEGRLSYEERPVLDVSIEQLLNHTHGLPGTSLRAPPRTPSGFIDIERLASAITANRPIALPGKMYSYSQEGYWICGGILERIRGMTFLELCGEELASRANASAGVVCPANGGSLSLSADRLLGLLQARATEPVDSDRFVAFPGWASGATGCNLGWHTYAGSWLGHNSALSSSPMLVRTHPERRISVVVASTGVFPAVVAKRLLGAELPDLVTMKSFGMPQNIGNDRLPRFVSRYQNGSTVADVRLEGGALVLDLLKGGSGNDTHRFRGILNPVTETTFYSSGELAAPLPVVEFIAPTSSHPGFLWTGEIALARTTQD